MQAIYECSVLKKWAQDEETLSEPNLAPTLPLWASYEKTSINIAITSSKVEDHLHVVLSENKNEISGEVLARSVDFGGHVLLS